MAVAGQEQPERRLRILPLKRSVTAMNGKRQKQIKAFLVEEFGEKKGGELFGKQTKTA